MIPIPFFINKPGRAVILSALFLSALAIAACSQAGPITAPDSEAAQRYDIRGVVVSVDRAKKEALIDHEEIPGYMPAMRMPFPVREDYVLAEMEAGDAVRATMVVADRGYWLENVSLTKGGPAPDAAIQGVEPATGSEAPPVSLVNQDGRGVNLRDKHNAARVVTFIYTRCPIPDYCILMSENFAVIHRAISEDADLRDRVRLLSVTLDPAFDTPEVLRAYGRRYAGEGPEAFARWEFATGQPEEIRRLAEYLGLSYREKDGEIVHSLSTAVFTPEGTLYKLYRGNEWRPSTVVNDLKTLLSSGEAR